MMGMRGGLPIVLLAGLAAAQDNVETRLRDPDPAVRRVAIREIAASRGVAAIPLLVEALYDPYPEVATAAVDGLVESGAAARSVAPLLEDLGLARPGLRLVLDRALVVIGRPNRGEPPLIRWMRARSMIGDESTSLARRPVAELLVALEAEDARVRAQAALALGLRGADEPEAIEALFAARGDDCAPVRGHAYFALLRGRKNAVAAFVKRMEEGDVATRRSAALALSSMSGAVRDALPALVAALSDSDFRVRRAAVVAIGNLRKVDTDVVEALIAAARKDESLRPVFLHACLLLARNAAPAVPAIVESLRDDDEAVRGSACNALASMREKAAPATPALARACYDEVLEVQQAALRALQAIGLPAAAAAPYVAELAEAHSMGEAIAAPALQALGAGRPLPPAPKPGDLERLLATLSGDDAEAAGRAAFSIGRLAPAGEQVRAALRKAMGSDAPYVRRHAALALCRIGVASAPVLIDAIGNGSTVERRLAADALWQLARPIGMDAFAAWKRALSDPDPRIRQFACASIGVLGPPAREAIPGLMAAIRDPDGGVASAASLALGEMGDALHAYAPELAAALLDQRDQRLGWFLVRALGLCGPAAESTIPAIVEALRRDPNLVSPAVPALADMGPAGLEAIADIVREGEGTARRFALEHLVRSATKPAGYRAALEAALKDEDVGLRNLALNALSHLEPEEAPSIDALIEALRRDTARGFQHSAVPAALAKAATPGELLDELAAETENERVRWGLLCALALMPEDALGAADRARIQRFVLAAFGAGSPAMGHVATELFRKYPPLVLTDDWIRCAAPGDRRTPHSECASVLALRGPQSILVLRRALEQKSDAVLRRGAAALARCMGPAAIECAIALADAVRVGDRDAAWYAQALVALGPEAGRAWIRTYDATDIRSVKSILATAIRNAGAALLDDLERARRIGDLETRRWVVSMMMYIGEPALTPLLAAAEDEDGRVASTALEGLARISSHRDRIGPVLAKALARRDTYPTAQRALGRMGEDALPYLLRVLDAKDEILRSRACAALGSCGEAAVPQIRPLMGDPDPRIRASAAKAAGSLPTPLVPELIRALRDESPSVRRSAVAALGRCKPVPEEARAEVVRLFRVGSDMERLAAEQALIGLNALDDLTPMFDSEDRRLRRAAARVLAKMRDSSVPRLVELVKTKDDPARTAAATALGQLRRQDELIELLRHGKSGVRASAAIGLSKIGHDAHGAVPLLCEMLDDSDPDAVKASLRALAAIGPAAEQALPKLEAMQRLEHHSSLVETALRRIRAGR